MQRHKKTKKMAGFGGIIFSAILFCAILAVVWGSVSSLGGTTGDEGVAATKTAIQRAVVVCYATEGYYPPSLSYMEERYGLILDRERYAISYEVFAQNVMPAVNVQARSPRE